MIYLKRESILRVIMANMVDAEKQETRQALADVGEELIRMDTALEEAALKEWEASQEAQPCTTATLAATDSTSL